MILSSPRLCLIVLIGLGIAACGYDSEKSAVVVVSEPEDLPQQREILILLSGDGALRFDGQPAELIDISRLAGKSMPDAGASSDESNQPRFIVAVDEKVEYELVVSVMSELKKIGAKDIEIAAAPKR